MALVPNDAVIVAAKRTPVGRIRGALSGVRPDDLAALAIRAVVPAALQEKIDEVFLGCANQAGEDNRNVARMAALLADLPQHVPGVTVNRLCASGLEAVSQAARMIRCGEAQLCVAGGVESMTRAPWAVAKTAEGFASGSLQTFDTSLGWRFPNPRLAAKFPLESMGETAENVAQKYGISRSAQDEFALASHQKALAGDFSAELLPVPLPSKKGPPTLFERDEQPRADSSLEKLATLKAAFRDGGSVTAGNSSSLNDGAAALLVCSAQFAHEHALTPLARIAGAASAGVDPRLMGMGPVPATQKLLARLGLTPRDLDLVELNEAFAAQSLAVIQELGLDPARVNVDGGAIAIGHPLGASGARLLTHLVHTLRKRGGRYGLATLCVGVGQGLSLVIESV